VLLDIELSRVTVEGPAHSIYLGSRVSLLSLHSPYPYRAIIPICSEPPQTNLVIALHPPTIDQAMDTHTVL